MVTTDLPCRRTHRHFRTRHAACLAFPVLLVSACSSHPKPRTAAPHGAHREPSIELASEAHVVIPDCSKRETAYFQCLLRGDAWGAVAICGQPGPDGLPVGLQVRLVTPDGTSVNVPAAMAQARSVLAMHVLTQPQLSYQAVSFEHEGRTWTVFSEYNAEVGGGVPSRGVRVTGAEPGAWSCAAEPIDRLGELEPYLTPDVAEPPLSPVAWGSR